MATNRYDENGAPTWTTTGTPIAKKSGNQSAPAASTAPVSGASNATYDTGDGVIKPGYIKDGLTYTDANYTQRVPTGSTVYAANGNSYKMGIGSGAPTPQTIANNYGSTMDTIYADVQKAYDEVGYEAIDAQARAAQLRVDQNRKQVGDAFHQSNRDAYSAYLMGSNPYGVAAQQRAAIGLNNSGLAETSQLALSSDYQNALSDAELARISALTELSNQEKEIGLNAAAQKAQLGEARAQYLAGLKSQAAGNVANLESAAATQAYNEGIDKRNWDYQLARDKISDERYKQEWDYMTSQDTINLAISLMEMGMPPENAAQILGVPQEYIDEWVSTVKSEWAAQRAQNGYTARRYNNSGTGGNGVVQRDGGGNSSKESANSPISSSPTVYASPPVGNNNSNIFAKPPTNNRFVDFM